MSIIDNKTLYNRNRLPKIIITIASRQIFQNKATRVLVAQAIIIQDRRLMHSKPNLIGPLVK